MSTPPDGIPPTMQMYLWHIPGASDDPATGDPFVPTSSAFDASVEYHEYTHGLSNRLVIDANGNSTLNDIQAGSMGEAWSDYYAMDYLVTKGFVPDSNEGRRGLRGQVPDGGQDRVPHHGDRLPRRLQGGRLHLELRRFEGWLHLRRLPDHHRWSRGARQRRGLGPDPVGHPQGVRSQRGRHA